MYYIIISLQLMDEFGEKYFCRVFRIIFQWRKVTWHACMREFTINDPSEL
jgi:hypothetical protein